MLWRWSGALLVALAAAFGLYWSLRGDPGSAAQAAPWPGDPADLALVGYLQAPGVDPRRCEVRCSPMRLLESPTVHRADLDADGRFVITGLSDEDYEVAVVARANPALVLARVQYVRPGGDELVIEADPSRLFGPAATAEEGRQ